MDKFRLLILEHEEKIFASKNQNERHLHEANIINTILDNLDENFVEENLNLGIRLLDLDGYDNELIKIASDEKFSTMSKIDNIEQLKVSENDQSFIETCDFHGARAYIMINDLSYPSSEVLRLSKLKEWLEIEN